MVIAANEEDQSLADDGRILCSASTATTRIGGRGVSEFAAKLKFNKRNAAAIARIFPKY